MSPQEKLARGLREMELDLSPDVQQKLIDYLNLLVKWNKVHNLTAVRDINEMITLHLLDSLVMLPHIQEGSLLDVGSGAGLPGIPLALVRPDLKITLLDSNHKKSTFQRQAKAELGLDNLQVVCSRVEAFQPEQKFEQIVSRAFSDLAEFVRLTSHLLADQGRWLAMKGVYPYDEIAQLHDIAVDVVPLAVPGLEAQRHLVFMKAII
jgi:16S rRNA (guanine527-N7)-methyltransferase